MTDFPTKLDRRNIGLALGGGAVLGGAHIGVLQALKEKQIRIDYIAGTSIGALVSALYAFGVSCDEMRKMALDLDWLDVSGLSFSKFGILNNEKIGAMVRKLIGDATFSQANIPLAINATDIGTGSKVILRSGSVAKAVMASTAVPGVFIPVEIDGRKLVDGGVLENVPLTALQNMGAEYMIGVDLNASQKFEEPHNVIDVLINTVKTGLISATRLQTIKADLLMEPDLSAYNLYNPAKIAEIIDKGYEEAKTFLENSNKAIFARNQKEE
jgi:NTE family protein